jgi:hypothetical protein
MLAAAAVLVYWVKVVMAQVEQVLLVLVVVKAALGVQVDLAEQLVEVLLAQLHHMVAAVVVEAALAVHMEVAAVVVLVVVVQDLEAL